MPASLEDLIRYGRGEFSQTNSLGGEITSLGERENALLEQVRQYDPNANWRFQDNSASTGEDGRSLANSWVLDFDHTKLPEIKDDEGVKRGYIGSSGGIFDDVKGLNTAFRGGVDPKWSSYFNYNDDGLESKGLRFTDENYGDMSFGARKKQKFDFGTLAPALVGLAASIPTGGASLGLLGSLMTAGPGLVRGINEGADPLRTILSAGAGAIPGLAGLSGLPSQLASMLIRSGINGRAPNLNPANLAMMLARYGINNL
jgi:hypothetical protein